MSVLHQHWIRFRELSPGALRPNPKWKNTPLPPRQSSIEAAWRALSGCSLGWRLYSKRKGRWCRSNDWENQAEWRQRTAPASWSYWRCSFWRHKWGLMSISRPALQYSWARASQGIRNSSTWCSSPPRSWCSPAQKRRGRRRDTGSVLRLCLRRTDWCSL